MPKTSDVVPASAADAASAFTGVTLRENRKTVRPRLIVVTDVARFGVEHSVERVRVVVERAAPGSVQVQLRDRELTARSRLLLGARLATLARSRGQTLSLNDRADLAALLGAAALHLGELSMSVADARALLGQDVWISRAWHPAGAALDDPATVDALLVSPVFTPRKGAPAIGLGGLTEALRTLADASVAASARPLLYALGGVDASNARACLEAGADGVAVIGAVFEADPQALLDALGISSR